MPKRRSEPPPREPLNFNEFCRLLNVKPEERVELVHYLAHLRYRQTIKDLLP